MQTTLTIKQAVWLIKRQYQIPKMRAAAMLLASADEQDKKIDVGNDCQIEIDPGFEPHPIQLIGTRMGIDEIMEMIPLTI